MVNMTKILKKLAYNFFIFKQKNQIYVCGPNNDGDVVGGVRPNRPFEPDRQLEQLAVGYVKFSARG